MQIESLEVLEKAEMPSAQARAIVRAIEIEMARATEPLATKQDIALLRQEIGVWRGEVAASIAGLATRAELGDLRAELGDLRAELGDVRAELDGVRAEVVGVRAELRETSAQLRGELRAEIHASASAITRQMYLAILGQMTVMLGFAYFFATHVR